MIAEPPADLDRSRAAVAGAGLVAVASGHLTGEVAGLLGFDDLGAYKTLLKRFFSDGPWTADDVAALDRLVGPHLTDEWWEHDLGDGLSLVHGMTPAGYRMWATGAAETAPRRRLRPGVLRARGPGTDPSPAARSGSSPAASRRTGCGTAAAIPSRRTTPEWRRCSRTRPSPT